MIRSTPSARRPWPALLVVVVAIVGAYWNTLHAPFVFDDRQGIVDNASIRTLWPLTVPLSPDEFTTGAVGRPVVNLSLAINYALGGLNVEGYHAVNILIHVAAALALFGVVRRTLAFLPRPDVRSRASAIAFSVALLWALHPLQTESVTCVIQRSESLLGFFYLATLYSFIRAAEESAWIGWTWLCVGACLLGMATKEVMVSAPLMMMLYDRTFLAGSFREAWRIRWRTYVALAATWILLVWLVAGHGQRSNSAGFGLGVAWWEYLLTQCRAIGLYLKLAFWPHPLVVDYGREIVRDPADVWLPGMILLALFGATLWALWRRPVWGFVGIWFFAMLAPSSSVVPLITQTVAEHRMYLPLVAVLLPVTVGLFAQLGRGALWVAAGIAVLAGVATVQRNQVYRSEISVWTDVIAHRPANARAHYNLGTVLDQADRADEAMASFRQAIRLDPEYWDAHYNLGNALARRRRFAEAVPSYEAALRARPDSVDARLNLGNSLLALGLAQEAIGHFRIIVANHPEWVPGHRNLGDALLRLNQTEEAIAAFREWLRLSPNEALAHYSLGNGLAVAERWHDAAASYRAALAIDPRLARAYTNLGGSLLALREYDEAITALQAALQVDPNDPLARENLARARAAVGAPAAP